MTAFELEKRAHECRKRAKDNLKLIALGNTDYETIDLVIDNTILAAKLEIAATADRASCSQVRT